MYTCILLHFGDRNIRIKTNMGIAVTVGKRVGAMMSVPMAREEADDESVPGGLMPDATGKVN